MASESNMRHVIIPKSDQINADDLLAGPMTITIRDVSIRPGTEQPVSIGFEGDGGKPWKPCKSMCRVLVAAWGPDAKQYIGRSATIYCDPKVKWGGMEVGGIRISHLSHIERETVMALTATKGKKAPFTIKPLAKVAQQPQPQAQQPVTAQLTDAASEAASRGLDAFRAFWKKLSQADRSTLQPSLGTYQERATLADEEASLKKQAEDAGAEISDDPFGDAQSAEPANQVPTTTGNKRAI